jgi:S1-C subfamily serine protease
MLSQLISFAKGLAKFTGSCIKGVMLVFTLAYMAIGLVFLTSMLLPPAAVSSHQVFKNLPKLAPSSKVDPTRSIVRLYARGDFVCTGVVIGNNYVLTAAHCLVDEEGKMKDQELGVVNDDGSAVIKGQLVGVNTRMDWGLIHGNFSVIPGAILVSTQLKIEPVVFACGYPQGSHFIHCENLFPKSNDAFLIKCLNGVLQPGMSGGPVFDKEGEVVGLNVQVYYATDGGGSAYTPTLGILSSFGIGD